MYSAFCAKAAETATATARPLVAPGDPRRAPPPWRRPAGALMLLIAGIASAVCADGWIAAPVLLLLVCRHPSLPVPRGNGLTAPK